MTKTEAKTLKELSKIHSMNCQHKFLMETDVKAKMKGFEAENDLFKKKLNQKLCDFDDWLTDNAPEKVNDEFARLFLENMVSDSSLAQVSPSGDSEESSEKEKPDAASGEKQT